MKLRIFEAEGYLVREIETDKNKHIQSFDSSLCTHDEGNTSSKFDKLILEGRIPESLTKSKEVFNVVDIFCGGGGFSLGAKIACNMLDMETNFIAAADIDAPTLETYSQNFYPKFCLNENVGMLVDHMVSFDPNGSCRFKYEPELLHEDLVKYVGKVDMIIGGPPCQGHSKLNNKTRSIDPRNDLYISGVAFAVALKPKFIVFENVADVVRDHKNVVDTGIKLLESAGYDVVTTTLNSRDFGVAQNRKRHFMIASKFGKVDIEGIVKAFKVEPERCIKWAIGDLESIDSEKIIDMPSELSLENMNRIKFLFENDLYELPNHERPDCHKDGHSYPSVYGRLSWNDVSGTITQGFLSPGRGRYIHPSQRRTLTAHEAARIQSFPDSYDFVDTKGDEILKGLMSKIIGDAVPPFLGAIPVLACLDQLDG